MIAMNRAIDNERKKMILIPNGNIKKKIIINVHLPLTVICPSDDFCTYQSIIDLPH